MSRGCLWPRLPKKVESWLNLNIALAFLDLLNFGRRKLVIDDLA
jgi:hypothetical protein